MHTLRTRKPHQPEHGPPLNSHTTIARTLCTMQCWLRLLKRNRSCRLNLSTGHYNTVVQYYCTSLVLYIHPNGLSAPGKCNDTKSPVLSSSAHAFLNHDWGGGGGYGTKRKVVYLYPKKQKTKKAKKNAKSRNTDKKQKYRVRPTRKTHMEIACTFIPPASSTPCNVAENCRRDLL